MTSRNATLKQLAEQSQEIIRRRQRCIDEAVKRTNDRIARLPAESDVSAQPAIQKVRARGNEEIANCSTDAKRESDELDSSERAQYELSAQQERDRSARMTTLTLSRPR
jgi:hypothetical protein